MFERPGKELLERAQEYALWRTMAAAILSAFGGIFLIPVFNDGGSISPFTVFLILGIIVAVPVITYRICRTKALTLYAMGQLVDDVQTIREHLQGSEEEEQVTQRLSQQMKGLLTEQESVGKQ